MSAADVHEKTLLVLDGNSLTYRAFYGIPTDMVTASGQVTNAVYGMTSMLLTLLKDHKPSGIVVAFDRPEPTFRHIAEPSYKAQREASPDILRQQMGIVKELLTAMGVSICELSGFEADDVIATVADQAVDIGYKVIIVTGDRDSYQLVRDPDVRVLYNKRGVSDYALYDEAGIFERTGVTPRQYIAYAALRGDPSDNLPGVPGVGEKTAAKLIATYGGLDGIFEHAHEQTPKLKSSLVENEQLARKNEDLMTLRHDAPIEIDLANLAVTPNAPEVARLFDFLEFKSMHNRFKEVLKILGHGTENESPVGAESIDESQVLHAEVTTAESSAAVVSLLTSDRLFNIAAEWIGEPGRSELVGLGITSEVDQSATMWVSAKLLSDDGVKKALQNCSFRAHDAKPIMRSLLRLGIDLQGLVLDTAIAAYLIDPAQNRYSLADLVTKYSNVRFPDDAAANSGQLDLDATGVDDAQRSGRNALATHHVSEELLRALDAQGMRALYDDMENPLVRVLARMEFLGIAVDREQLKSIAVRLTNEARELSEKIQALAGYSFNPNSTAQLGKILFEEKGLTPPKKTKTGYSTDAATLEKLRDEWPEFIDPLMRYREMEKLRGTYGEGLLAEVAIDGRIHATFNQTVARTGRLSSDQPNLHNIPTRTEEGRVFRTAFVAAPGCELMVADYNQIELRCIAHLANDPGLIEAFTSGQDVHSATAARVFGIAQSDVSYEQRSKAKMVSYGLAYGMEAFGLGQRLGIRTDEAAEILNAYFAAFPNVQAYMDRTVAEAKTRGYTETLFGRRRRIPELENSNFRIRQAGERQAMNAAIQGLAADIFKIALIRIDAALSEAKLASRLVLQVHDEVIVEVPHAERDQVEKLVLDIMQNATALDVPLAVNSAWGATWAEAKS
ncbi:MAG: DNA polymerase I [Ilumatobacteraceae bacterium]|nr:DNA polymerase I [Ilumatobacteraceae bacterium]MDP4976612.1 DNA polymerase I [Ilumatobacteraceae bacterium]